MMKNGKHALVINGLIASSYRLKSGELEMQSGNSAKFKNDAKKW